MTPIDTATNTAGTAITVGQRVQAASPSPPTGQTAYVANTGRGTVTPIDHRHQHRRRRRSPWASVPTGIAITPNGQTAYVANNGSGTVTPIDTATNTAGTAITGGE